MIGIYKITSPTKKVYIGQSIDIQKRFNTYKILNCKSQTILYNSLLKYGFEKHKFEVLCECDILELNDKERYYQDLYDVLNKGLNCRLTASSDKSGKVSEETKRKVSEIKKGNKYFLGKCHSQETKQKLSESKKGNKHFLGKKHSEKSILKIIKSNTGKKRSEETKKKMLETYKVLFDKNETEGVFGISLVESPAMESNFIALNKEDNLVQLKAIDNEKRILLGAVLVPDKKNI